MTWTPPAVNSDFKDMFDRDFIFGTGLDSVRDKDIDRAFNDARSIYNSDLFVDDAERKMYFLYAAAHCLWRNIDSAGGLSALTKGGLDGQGEGLVTSKSVGPISMATEWAERVKQSPTFSELVKSKYGVIYTSIVWPRTRGGLLIAEGYSEF